jgi:hypothetical protein
MLIPNTAQGLQFRCGKHGYMQVSALSVFILMEQPSETRSVLNDEFLKLQLIRGIPFGNHTNACKARGVDPDATKAEASINHQAL